MYPKGKRCRRRTSPPTAICYYHRLQRAKRRDLGPLPVTKKIGARSISG